MLRFISKTAATASALATIATASAATPPVGTLRLTTFNLYNRPYERAQRLENAIEILRKQDADVICLQEVAMGWILRGGDPSERIARELGYPHRVRFWHEENLGIFRTGLAILSKHPIEEPIYREFARHGFWDAKGYLLAHIALPGGKRLPIVNLHLASTRDDTIRQAEWTELEEVVKPLQSKGPVLVTGDFNTQPSHTALRGFVERTRARSLYDGWKNIDRMRTWTPDYRDSCGQSRDPAAELIDFVFALPANTGESIAFTGGRIVLSGKPPHASDHCPVSAELQISGARTTTGPGT